MKKFIPKIQTDYTDGHKVITVFGFKIRIRTNENKKALKYYTKKYMQLILSVKNIDNFKVFTICGLKLRFNLGGDHWQKKGTNDSIKTQNQYDLTLVKNAEKLIVFFNSPDIKMCGGIMSTFNLCKYSREICKDAFVLISTMPGRYTHCKNTYFDNNEQIWRWEQIIENVQNKKEVILHIPEYLVPYFYNHLCKTDISLLKNIPQLHLNIMNQNIDLMPKPEEIRGLYILTDNITQTIAHDRYSSQEICDKWGIPTHLFSAHIDLSPYKSVDFSKKEKLILLSPDECPQKEVIINKLIKLLPDYELKVICEMSFSKCMELTAKSLLTITFGEGFDGYLIHPVYVGSLGASVYNERFFPDKSWLKLKNIYSSYDEIAEKIVEDIKYLENNKEEYEKLIKICKDKFNPIYSFEKYYDNLKRFYMKKYDFYPQTISVEESETIKSL